MLGSYCSFRKCVCHIPNTSYLFPSVKRNHAQPPGMIADGETLLRRQDLLFTSDFKTVREEDVSYNVRFFTDSKTTENEGGGGERERKYCLRSPGRSLQVLTLAFGQLRTIRDFCINCWAAIMILDNIHSIEKDLYEIRAVGKTQCTNRHAAHTL